MSALVQVRQVQRGPRGDRHIRQHDGGARGFGLAGRGGPLGAGEGAAGGAFVEIPELGGGRHARVGGARTGQRSVEG